MPQSPSINPLIPRFNQLKWKMAGAGILVGLTSGLLVVLCRSGRAYCVDDCQGADGVR